MEYRWDLAVPFGTEVHAIEPGRVLGTKTSNVGGCSSAFLLTPGHVLVEQSDGTVAQYTHVTPLVKEGDLVGRDAVIAVTAKNGDLCVPHLDFLLYRSRDTTADSPHPESLPLWFDDVPGGIARQGTLYTAR